MFVFVQKEEEKKMNNIDKKTEVKKVEVSKQKYVVLTLT